MCIYANFSWITWGAWSPVVYTGSGVISVCSHKAWWNVKYKQYAVNVYGLRLRHTDLDNYTGQCYRCTQTETCTCLHDGLQWSSSVEQTHQNSGQMTNEWGPKTAENIFTLSWWNGVTWQTECVIKCFYCLLVTVASNDLIYTLVSFTFSRRPHLLLHSLNYQDNLST